ncbi:FG-GAP-like repeat-containing protein [Novipirellula artificiosorum]|uniref:ASPIC and UnbV n=1 Tax=Novipirellula artificiosorum TaxID=2528016 RepID=A0A5C6DZN6_9BACT|nr:FG-GAP-like repeat-containing protein [Novipirellula artificiosorum]TWU42108.1 ASPIC and UnbV [Novipirellula artificiosorum]
MGISLVCLFFVGCRESDPPPKQTPAAETKPDPLAEASALIQQGKLDQAERILLRLQVQDPNDLATGTLLVTLLNERNDLVTAAGVLDDLAEANPKQSPRLLAQAAELIFESGDDLAAFKRFQAILDSDPTFAAVRRRFAACLNQRGFRAEANQQLRTLGETSPLSLAELRALCFPHRVWFDVAQKPDIHDARQIRALGVLNAARALRSQGDVRECLELLDCRDDLWQRTPASETLYGWTLANSQQNERLAQWLALSSTEWKNYCEYWLAVAQLAMQDQPTAAAECFARAIMIEPNSLEAHQGMVQALELANKQEAADAFRERVRLVQHNQQLMRRIVGAKQIEQLDYTEMANILAHMGRPLESVLWQELLFSRIAPMSQQMRTLQQYKSKLMVANPSGIDASSLLCGTELHTQTEYDDLLVAIREKVEGGMAANKRPSENDGKPIANPLPPVFANVAMLKGIHFAYQNATKPVERHFQIFQAYGSGVACLDYDADGRVDFYFGQAATTPPNELSPIGNGLFRNVGDQFKNVIEPAAADDRHYSTGVTAGDWNQDGWMDIAIANLGPNRLLINQGDGTFQVQRGDALWDQFDYTTSLAIADITGDHLPDLVTVNYIDDQAIYLPIEYDAAGKPVRLPGPLHFRPGLDRLFVSQVDGTMRSESFGKDETAIASSGLGLLITDMDGSGKNQVFVANDQRANQWWIPKQNDSDSRAWSDVAVARGVAYGQGGMPMACMGIATADFDRNGLMDMHITNFENQWSNLYMQSSSGMFSDQVVTYGLETPTFKMLGFGTQAIDYDNNTTSDIVIGNGHIEDFRERGIRFDMPSQILSRSGHQFVEAEVSGDDEYWKAGHLSRGMAQCDFNRDGRVDVVVTDLKENVALLENRTKTPNHFLQLELRGVLSERDAIGSRVTVRAAEQTQTTTVQTGDGYLSKNESVLFFGLGDATSIEEIEVQWPSGTSQTFTAAPIDCRLLIIENEPNVWVQ